MGGPSTSVVQTTILGDHSAYLLTQGEEEAKSKPIAVSELKFGR